MNKADAIKLVEDFAHFANAFRLQNMDVWQDKDENMFWGLINRLPKDIKESVIN